MAVLPTTFPRWADAALVADAHQRYAELAARRGTAFLDCGRGLDPADTALFADGLHPKRAGLHVLLACMRKGLQPLLG